jgi:hypothetical protein
MAFEAPWLPSRFRLRFLVAHLPSFGSSHGNPYCPRCPGFAASPFPASSSECLRKACECLRGLPTSVTWILLCYPGASAACQRPMPGIIGLVEWLRAAMRLIRSGAGHGPRSGIEAQIALRPREIARAGSGFLRLLALILLPVGGRLCPGHSFSTPPGVGCHRLGQRLA